MANKYNNVNNNVAKININNGWNNENGVMAINEKLYQWNGVSIMA
jgi:hypothetical protein